MYGMLLILPEIAVGIIWSPEPKSAPAVVSAIQYSGIDLAISYGLPQAL